MKLINYLNAIKFLFNKYPSHVVFFVTGRCNAKCKHCFYWNEIKKAKKKKELTFKEIENISKKFGHIKLLSITGGEPTLRNDIADIVHTFHRNNGVTNVIIHTNGFLSKNIKDIATEIAKENPNLELNISVSVDGLEKKHNEIRGVKTAFENVQKTIKLLTKEKINFKNLNVTVNTCFSYFNQDEIKDMIDYFFKDFDIDGYYIALVRGNSMNKKAKDIDINKYKTITNYLYKKNIIKRYYKNYPLSSFRRTIDFLAPKIVIETLKKKKMIYSCKAGKSVIVISEEGDVFPCEMLNKKFGNLRETDYNIKRLLSPQNQKFIKSYIKTNKCYCTWECAIMNNLVFNWKAYPNLLFNWLKLKWKATFGE